MPRKGCTYSRSPKPPHKCRSKVEHARVERRVQKMRRSAAGARIAAALSKRVAAKRAKSSARKKHDKYFKTSPLVTTRL